MKQYFVIVASGGSYDDAWERVQFVTDDLSKGQAYCDDMNEVEGVPTAFYRIESALWLE